MKFDIVSCSSGGRFLGQSVEQRQKKKRKSQDLGGEEEGRPAVVVQGVDAAAGVEQQVGGRRVALEGGVVQRRPAGVVAVRFVQAAFQQPPHHLDAALHVRERERERESL